MKNVTITISITAEDARRVAELCNTRQGKSVEDVYAQVWQRGLYDMCYRQKRNREQYQQYREWKQSQKGN